MSAVLFVTPDDYNRLARVGIARAPNAARDIADLREILGTRLADYLIRRYGSFGIPTRVRVVDFLAPSPDGSEHAP